MGLPPLVLLVLYLGGQYKRQLRRALLDDMAVLASAVSIAAMALIAIALGTDITDRSAVVVAPAWGLAVALGACGRTALIVLQTRQRMTRRSQRPALIGVERELLSRNTQWATHVRCLNVEVHEPYSVGECRRDLERLGFGTSLSERHWASVTGRRQ